MFLLDKAGLHLLSVVVILFDSKKETTAASEKLTLQHREVYLFAPGWDTGPVCSVKKNKTWNPSYWPEVLLGENFTYYTRGIDFM